MVKNESALFYRFKIAIGQKCDIFNYMHIVKIDKYLSFFKSIIYKFLFQTDTNILLLPL